MSLCLKLVLAFAVMAITLPVVNGCEKASAAPTADCDKGSCKVGKCDTSCTVSKNCCQVECNCCPACPCRNRARCCVAAHCHRRHFCGISPVRRLLFHRHRCCR